jgi:integrase
VDPKLARQKLGTYAGVWWGLRVVEATTAATDRGRLDNHVLPAWEDMPLNAITNSAVKAWAKRLTRDGLGAWSVRSCHALLSSILEAAVRDGLIPANPARNVGLPAKPLHREVFLTREEVDQVAAAMSRRPGAVDFDTAVLMSLVLTGLRWGRGPALSRHHWPRTVFQPALAGAGLGGRDVHVHDLRHTYASWLAQAGVSGTKIAALIGDTPATAEKYTHLAPDHFGDALAALARPGAEPARFLRSTGERPAAAGGDR